MSRRQSTLPAGCGRRLEVEKRQRKLNNDALLNAWCTSIMKSRKVETTLLAV
jgi:hypothetical protein